MSLFTTQNVPYLGFSTLVVLLTFWVSKRVGLLVEASWAASAGHRATAKFLRRFAQLSTLLLGIGAALRISGVDASILIGAATFAIGYALRNWISNLLSGVIIAVSKVIDVGWFITSGEGGGSVMEISAMSTKLKTISNQTILIPNSSLVSEPLGIYGQYPERLVVIEYSLSHDTNPTTALATIETVVSDLPELSQVPEPPLVLLKDFSQGPQVYEVRFWIAKSKLKGNIVKYRTKVNLRIWKALEDAGMEMPFQVTTLNVNVHDSGALTRNQLLPLLRRGTAASNIG